LKHILSIMLLRFAENTRRLLVCFSLALGLTLGSGTGQAGGVGVSLATDGRTTAQLVCNGSVVLDQVYYLRLVLSDGALLISYRESLRSGAPEKVLILTSYGRRCQAQENNFSFSRFKDH
jgi:hypothetical protein